jgi:hypothetical protein
LFGLGLWTWLSTIGHAAAPVKPEVETRPASPLGNSAFTANGRIQPHGLPTKYWFEFGPTETYGNVTRPQSLPPKRAAYYHEIWDHGPGGWMGGKGLVHHSTGVASAGFMRFREPSGDDPATLTDGWRHGQDRSWKSAPNPNGPLEFVYAFQTPVTVQTIQLHQHAE